MQAILHEINIALFWLIVIGLGLGVYRFRHLDMIGPWFRWKCVGYILLTVYDWFVLYQAVPHTLFLGDVARLTLARVIIAWEVWYCMHWRFYQMNGRQQTVSAALTHDRHPPRE